MRWTPSILLLSLLSLGAPWSEKAVRADTTPMEFDTFKSSIVALTHRAGMLGFLGHEHALWAVRFTGNLSYSFPNLRASSVEIAIPVGSLDVDSGEARRRGQLTSGGPSEKDALEIRNTVLSPAVLDAGKFPEVRFRSTAVETQEGSKTEILLKGSFILHGVTREVAFPLKISSSDNGALHFTGTLKFKLSDYGIKPPSSAAGTVGVQDEMEIRLDIFTKPLTVVA